MKLLSMRPEIYSFPNVESFTGAFQIGKHDLILTNRCILPEDAPVIQKAGLVVWQEDYGTGEPNDVMIEAVRNAGRKVAYERIIAVGGGTVLDIGKLLSLKGDLPIERLGEPGVHLEKEKELVLVPTTCGTGSEMTNISIITITHSGVKSGVVSDVLYADAAVLIPELIDALPYQPFAASLIDALIHSAESFVSPRATRYTKIFSEKAMELILVGLREMRENGQDWRKQKSEQFLFASNMAGIAFGNAGCGAVHAMSYPLGATYHVAHGVSNYVLFTQVLRTYRKIAPNGKIAELEALLAQILGCGREKVYDELEGLLGFLLPRRYMCDFGVQENDLGHFVEDVETKQGRLMANACVPLPKESLHEIYREVLHR
jgi:4-hydroxybutyrate dehydrogenase